MSHRLGSQPETTEDCSGGETTRLPEATNVRTKNPDEDLTQPLTSQETIINGSKDKRCARIETISMNDVVGVPLSLTRRDVNLEKLKQRCESCRNTNMCKKHKMCALCKSPCEKVEAAEATEIPPETSTAIPQPEITVGSRFGDEENEKPRYYSLGLIPPGPLLHLFAKAFNIPSEENFEKLIIIGKLKGADMAEDLNNLYIIDMAHVFGNHKQTFATVHQPINVDPAKIADLDRKLDEALTRRKEELNTDRLSNDQIREVIDQVLAQMSQINRPTEAPNKDTEFVEAPETETKCSVDEAMNDLLEVIPMTTPEKAKEETKSQLQPQPQIEEPEEKQQITNPPVIQDGFNMVGKSVEKSAKADPKTEEKFNTADNVIGDGPPEVLTVPGDVKPGPESDNQIQTRARQDEHSNLAQNVFKTVEDSLKIGSGAFSDEPQQDADPPESPDLAQNVLETVENDLKMASTQESASSNLLPKELARNIFKTVQDNPQQDVNHPQTVHNADLAQNMLETVKDGLKIASNQESASSNLLPEDLAKNIFKTVQDGFKIVSTERPSTEKVAEDLRKNVVQTVEDSLKVASDVNTPDSKNVVEADEPVFLQSEDERRPSQINVDELTPSVVQFPERPSEMEVSNNENFGNPETPNENQNEDMIIPKKDNFMNVQENSMSSESIESEEQDMKFIPVENNPKVAETLPQVEIRGQFSDESVSNEKLSSFGQLVPLKNLPADGDTIKNVFFVGKDIKLPLQMFQDKDGVMQLRVDVDKLCHCKNTNCTKNHAKSDENNNLETEEMKNKQLMNSFVDHPQENSEISKRSPKIESQIDFSQKNSVDAEDDKVKIDGVYKFQVEEEKKFEKELKRINDNLKEYFSKEDSLSLNKGTVALYKDVEKTKDVSRMITLANNLLVWMKDLAVNNLNS